MRFLLKTALAVAFVGAVIFGALLVTDRPETVEITSPDDPSVVTAERGELLLGLAGCVNCHTAPGKDAAPLAGGRALETPFGTFYAPNITSDPEHGIGEWSPEDFVRALRFGRRPDGAHYFPAFPYVAYSRMTDADMLTIRKAILARAGVAQANTPHDLAFPFNQRWGMRFWKLLHFDPGAFAPDAGKSDAWNRGAYISTALAHCAECHTPRYPSGGLDYTRWMGGAKDGPEGEAAPNITPDERTGLGPWADSDIAFALKIGLKPNGDVVGSTMYEVVEKGTGKLSDADRAAIVEYLRGLKPIANAAAPASEAGF